MTYVGELGWELFVATEFAAGVYDDIHQAGADLGVTDAGYYAIESLRIEKGYRAWGRELTPDVNPYEAGLAFAVALDKPTDFIGQDALRRFKQTATLNRRILQFTLDDPDPVLWGGELILRDSRPVGELRSAAYGYTLAAATGLGWIQDETSIDAAYIANATWQIDIAGTLTPATAHLRTPYDPKSERVRSDS
jgi:4-methylaminobutanoate oxidase (formaldehyde-forming)